MSPAPVTGYGFSSHVPILTADIQGAYPVAISSIELDHSNSELMEFTVTFAYDLWVYKEIYG